MSWHPKLNKALPLKVYKRRWRMFEHADFVGLPKRERARLRQMRSRARKKVHGWPEIPKTIVDKLRRAGAL